MTLPAITGDDSAALSANSLLIHPSLAKKGVRRPPKVPPIDSYSAGSEPVRDRVDDRLPALERQFLDRRRYAEAGIVEQPVEPAEPLLGLGENVFDRRRVGDVGRHRQDLPAESLDLVRHL